MAVIYGDPANLRPVKKEAPHEAPLSSRRVYGFQQQLLRLLPKLRVAVIFGGNKSVDGAVIRHAANPRSWRSYQSVAEDIAVALKRLGCGYVCLLPDNMLLGERLRGDKIHLAWLNTGGVQGYHAPCHAAAMLEMFGVPYVGHDPLNTCTLDNKHAFKRILKSLDIATPPSITWSPRQESIHQRSDTHFLEAFGNGKGPFVVKPVTGRASLNVHVVDESVALPRVAEEVYRQTENLVLIERFLPGREFCISVCGRITAQGGVVLQQSHPFTFSAIERVLPAQERIFASMDTQPINSQRFMRLSTDYHAVEIRQLEAIARTIYDELHLESIIRIDIRADENGKLHVLEANPKPDLKKPTSDVTSLVCDGLEEKGMSYDDLILSLLADRLLFLIDQRRGSSTQLRKLMSGSESPLDNALAEA